jgi:RES domain-containing protein
MGEVRVHLDLDWDMLPDDYVLVAIDTAAIVAETINEPPDDPRAIGDAWIESRRSALLRVPSWIVPESYNVLINPTHPDAPLIQLGSVRPFQFDQRPWTPAKFPQRWKKRPRAQRASRGGRPMAKLR